MPVKFIADNIDMITPIAKIWSVTISTVLGIALFDISVLDQINGILSIISEPVVFILKIAALLMGMIYTHKTYKLHEKKKKQD
jgi:fumarate reductase subunit C